MLVITRHVGVDEGEFTPPLGVVDVGHYNKMPEPYREVSAHDYWHWPQIWIVDFSESRQITGYHNPELTSKGGYLDVKIQWSWWGGFGIHGPKKWELNNGEDIPFLEGNIIYDLTGIRYFMFGCKHDFQEVARKGMHYHQTKCVHCGMNWNYDSSG